MPLVKIFATGYSADELDAICNGVHEALASQANVPSDDRFQVVAHVEKLVAHPTYGGVDRKRPLFIEITLNAGRTNEIKKALYADIAARLLQAADVRPDDVLVSLIEVTKENWSFGGGRMTYG